MFPVIAGALLGIGPDRVSQLVRQGVLPAMRTPGGHVRVRRDKVEEMANPKNEPPGDDRGGSDPVTDDGALSDDLALPDDTPASPPKWHHVPPWTRKVHEAEADLKVLEFEDQKDQLLDARSARQQRREHAQAQQAATAAEAERLRRLKARVLLLVPLFAPTDVRARAARLLEHALTSARYPAGLGSEHVESLLRNDVERFLRPWREREAAAEQEKHEAREGESLVSWAVLRAKNRMPRDWDWNTKRDFEREVRQTLKDELEPGMDQDDADEIAFAVLDEWLADDECDPADYDDEEDEDEYDDDEEDGEEDEYEDGDDG
jgi:excisionase family DNA binding protein